MQNLLKETESEISNNNLEISDVVEVIFRNSSFSAGKVDSWQKGNWEDFAKLADRKYDEGFGCAEVEDVMIIFKDGSWLERYEYDGSEWWEYKKIPVIPSNCPVLPLIKIFADQVN